MHVVYFILDRATGETVLRKTWDNEKDAKLALRLHFGSKRNRTKYAVARAVIIPTPIAIINEAGEWEAAPNEDA